MKKTLAAVFAVVAAFLLAAPSQAAVKQWVNVSNDNKWSSPSNWSPAGVPTAADTVEIGTAQTANNVTLDVNATIAGLTMSAPFLDTPTLTLNNTTLTVNGTATVGSGAKLSLVNGTVTGSGALNVSGTLHWSGGTLSGGAAVTINGGATVTVDTSGTKYLDTRTLNNSGTMNISGAGTFYFGNGATLANQSGGLVHVTSDLGFHHYTGTVGAISNAGTFRKSVATGTTTFGTQAFTNTGTIDLQSGTLHFGGGGANSGAFTTSAGTTLLFPSSTFTLNSGTTFSGSGVFEVSGATLTLATGLTATLPTLEFNNGTINGAGTLSTGSGGTITWNGGTITGGGSLTVPTGGTLALASSSTKYLDARPLTISSGGTVNVTGSGTFYLGNGATVSNGGLLHMISDAGIYYYTGAAASIVNTGTFRKSTATGTTIIASNVGMTNSGTIDVQSGILRFDYALSNTGTIQSLGGATIVFQSGTAALNAGTTLNTAGDVRLLGGSLNIPTGVTVVMPTLSIEGGAATGAGTLSTGSTGTIDWTNGTIQGLAVLVPAGGTLNLSGVSTKYLDAASVTINGTTNLSGTGTLYMGNGASVVTQGTGLFHTTGDADVYHYTGSAGSFTNNATFRKSTDTGVTIFTTSITFTNTGTVDVDSGTLRLDGGGANSGALDGAAGTTIQFYTGTFALNSGTTFPGAGEVRLTGATLTIATGVTVTIPTFLMEGGTVNGAGTLTPGATGTITWSGGTMGGTGITSIPAGGTLALLSNQAKILDTRTLNNAGSVTVTGTGHFYFANAAAMNNQSGGTFELMDDAGVHQYTGASGSFANAGTLRRTTDTSATAFGGGILFTSSGAVIADSGTLRFDAGGTHTGTVTANTGATIHFSSGTHLLDTASATSGAGTIKFSGSTMTVAGSWNVTGTTDISSGTANFNAAATTSLLDFSGGTANFNAATTITRFNMTGGILAGTGTVTINGTAYTHTWSGGQMNGSGNTIFAAGTTSSFPSTTYTYITTGRTITNNGTINFGTAGNLNYYPYLSLYNDGSKIENNGAFNLVAGEAIVSSGTFNNNAGGTITKSGGTTVSTFSVVVNNAGSVVVSTGGFAMHAGGTHTGPFSVAAGATLEVGGGGTHTFQAASSIASSGTLLVSGATTTINAPYTTSGTTTTRITNGTVHFNTGVSTTNLELTAGTANFNAATSAVNFSMANGTLGGTGAVTITGTGPHSWSGGAMTAAGTTTFAAGSTLTMPNTTYTYLTAGRALVTNGTVNYGTAANPNYYPYLHIYPDGSSLTSNGAFNLLANESIVSGGTFTNAGTLTKNGGTGTSQLNVIVNNSGSVVVTTGTLQLDGSGTHTGPFSIASGATLRFSGGTHTVQASSSITSNGGTLLFTAGTTTIAGAYTTSGLTTTRVAGGTVTFNTGVTNDLIDITNGAVAFNAATNTTRFSMTGGTLGGTGTVNVTGTTTTHTWSGGTMTGAGSTIFAVGSTLSMPSTTYTYLTSGRVLMLNGTTSYGTPGNPNYYPYLHVYNDGSTINNNGAFTLVANEIITSSGTFNNGATGTVTKSGGTNTSTLSVIFNNAGAVLVSTGTLVLDGGGTHTGPFTIASGKTLQFSGWSNHTFGAAITNNGGTLVFSGATSAVNGAYTTSGTTTTRVSGGTVAFNTAVTTTNLEITNGTADFNAATAITNFTMTAGALGGTGVVTISGTSPNHVWSGGTMNDNGVTTFAAGTTLSIPNTNYTYVTGGRTLNLNGTTIYGTTSNPNYYPYLHVYSDGSDINNAGSFQLAGDQSIVSGGIFNNTGTLTKTAGTGTSALSLNITNSGTVRSASGILRFEYPGYVQTGGTLSLDGGSYDSDYGFTIQGGAISGAGTIDGWVDNAGIIRPGGTTTAGALTITGDLTLQATADVDIELGGTTPGTQYDQLLVGGDVLLAGDLNVSTINSFVPASGNTFQILTFATRPNSTDFANKNGLNVGAGTNLIPAYSATDLQLTTNTVQADIAASMTASPASVNNGQQIVYTVTVTNLGGSNASGVSFMATLPANVTFVSASPAVCTGTTSLSCTIGNLANQASSSVAITVTANGTGNATVTASAVASQFDPNGANNTASATAGIGTGNADLAVTIADSPDPATAGAAIGYTIVVTNNGPQPANGVSLAVTAPATLTFSSANAPCAGGFPCNIGTLASGASVTINASYTVASTATGTVQLTANVSATSPADATSANNSATASTTLNTAADVSVQKTGPTSIPQNATSITYTINVTNNGPSHATGVVLSDPAPPNLIFTSATGACTSFPCSLGSMTVGQVKTTTVTFSIEAGTTFTNTASVTSTSNDPNANNDSSSITTTKTTCPPPTLTAPSSVQSNSTGNAASTPVVAGATYAWTITNGTITSSTTANAITFTAGATGSVALTVSVTANNCTSSATANVPIMTADVWIAKSGPATAVAGSQITFEVRVTNAGAGSASGVTVTDPTPAGLTFIANSGGCNTPYPCALGTLPQGEVVQIFSTYTVNANATGTITNTATVAASTNDSNPNNNSASASTQIAAAGADLAINKSGPAVAQPNTQIEYTVVVGNHGPLNAAGVSVADPTPARLAFVSNSGACTTPYPCTIGAIPAGQSVTIVSRYNVLPGTTPITNTATVSSTTTDPVSANNSSSVTTSAECANDPIATALPHNGASNVATSGTLTWTNVGAASYSVYLAPKSNGGCSVPFASSSGGSLEYHNLQPNTLYEWKVIGHFAGCPDRESACATFTTATNCNVTKPSIIRPAAGASVTSPVTFEWTAVANATKYTVFASTGGAAAEVGSTTGTTLTGSIASDGTVEWYVVASVASCGEVRSNSSTFSICNRPQPPSARVVGQTVSGQGYAVEWDAVPNAVRYELQTSESADFANATTTSLTTLAAEFRHEVTETKAFYYRVRAFTACSATPSDYSLTVRVIIIPLPPVTTEEPAPSFNVPAGSTQVVIKQVFIPGEPNQTLFYTAAADREWLSVRPVAGFLPPEGVTVEILADPSDLPNGTFVATLIVTVTDNSSGKVNTNATTAKKVPVSISLVTPITPVNAVTSPTGDSLIIPSIGHLSGINSHWQSDIRVANTSDKPAKYDLIFTPSVGAESGIKKTTINVEAGATTALDDVVKNWFGVGNLGDSANGMLEIRPIDGASITHTIASSRTYNVTNNGTLGQHIPALPFVGFVGKSVAGALPQVLSLQQIAQSSAFRTNVGVLEASGNPTSVVLSIFNSAGTNVKDIAVDLKGGEQRQLNGLLATHGITLDDGRIEVKVTDGIGKVSAYASVVDNKSLDPLLVSGFALGANNSTRWVLPGVADLNTGIASWRTDMRVFNSGLASQSAKLTMYPIGAAPITTTLALQPGEVRTLDDVVKSMFKASNIGGAVHVETDNPSSLVVTGRTYNQTGAGTFGQFIPAVAVEEAVGRFDRSLNILQVEDSSRYRTNIGLAEVTGKPVRVEVMVYLPDSKVTPFIEVPLAANEFRQLSVIRDMNLGDVYNARVVVRVIDGNGKVAAYGSVVDMKTQDPTYVQAQ